MERSSKSRHKARRRARLRHAALTKAPLWLSRGRLRRSRSVCHVRSTERTIALPDLPDALDGLRVAHISDLHVGEVLQPEALPAIVADVNALQADLIAFTGDLVDLSLDVLDDCIAALQQLTAPLGVYLVLGNHDHLDDGHQFARRVRAAGLKLLVNESLLLPWRGSQVRVAGIDFATRRQQLARLVHRTMLQAGPRNGEGARLLLAHHPDAFDPACRHHVDLTLSGHTHGGQLVLGRSRGKRGLIGLGSLAFRYPRGLYRRGSSYLYVTTGVGSWFPLRIRCPAEIACLTLRSQPDPLDPVSHP